MNRKLFLYCSLFLALVSFYSCSKDDESYYPNTVIIDGQQFKINGGLLDKKIEWVGEKYYRAFDMVLYGGGIKLDDTRFSGEGFVLLARLYVTGTENYLDNGKYLFGVTPKPMTFSRIAYSITFDVDSADNEPLIPLDAGSMSVTWENQHTIYFDVSNNSGTVLSGMYDGDMIIR